MASILAIVSKSVFEQDRDMSIGDLFETSEYQSKNKALESIAEGGSLFLVTARPGDELWLVGILEQPVFVGDRWTAQANIVKCADITELVDRLVFETGAGLKAKPGALGMALQSPRKLTDADVALLRKAAVPSKPAGPPGRRR
ncbi:MAG: hypothetical protein H6Q90_6263 [Deltaproteobacteria bacterium]|nr:hypothetical protein [Deltaproteobacteria bacterium]